ncbi:hypothetical protein R3P38DRAFT_2587169 [Favolaschia claudopus]|uniref:C2H2-type domain-containing protein n=1 Tax=Favolaschia claudopus TaxID=2862362 RepID=A0AAV9Z4A8_9AGAR
MSQPSLIAAPPSHDHNCLWRGCSRSFSDPESFYNHMCNDHVGRKNTNNLCLTCKWKDCNSTFAKRGRITSHLRVHTNLRPHVCEICEHSFKRLGDLKRHRQTHTEVHRSQHKRSKALVVPDPACWSKEVKNSAPSGTIPGKASSQAATLSAASYDLRAEWLAFPAAQSRSADVAAYAVGSGLFSPISPDFPYLTMHNDHSPGQMFSGSVDATLTGSEGYQNHVAEFLAEVEDRNHNPYNDRRPYSLSLFVFVSD